MKYRMIWPTKVLIRNLLVVMMAMPLVLITMQIKVEFTASLKSVNLYVRTYNDFLQRLRYVVTVTFDPLILIFAKHRVGCHCHVIKVCSKFEKIEQLAAELLIILQIFDIVTSRLTATFDPLNLDVCTYSTSLVTLSRGLFDFSQIWYRF